MRIKLLTAKWSDRKKYQTNHLMQFPRMQRSQSLLNRNLIWAEVKDVLTSHAEWGQEVGDDDRRPLGQLQAPEKFDFSEKTKTNFNFKHLSVKRFLKMLHFFCGKNLIKSYRYSHMNEPRFLFNNFDSSLTFERCDLWTLLWGSFPGK